MMPTKDLDTSTGRYTVAFRLPPEAGAEQAWLAGDFNEWSTEALPMHREADGGMLALVEDLEPGTELRFRYYLGGGAWENDWAADAYVDNEFGGADSLLVLPAVESPPDVKGPGADAGEPVTSAASAIGAAAEAAAVVEHDVIEPAKAEAPVEKKAPPKKKAAAAKKAAPAKKAAAKKATPVKPPKGTDTA
jgi:hypothetical protein